MYRCEYNYLVFITADDAVSKVDILSNNLLRRGRTIFLIMKIGVTESWQAHFTSARLLIESKNLEQHSMRFKSE